MADSPHKSEHHTWPTVFWCWVCAIETPHDIEPGEYLVSGHALCYTHMRQRGEVTERRGWKAKDEEKDDVGYRTHPQVTQGNGP